MFQARLREISLDLGDLIVVCAWNRGRFFLKWRNCTEVLGINCENLGSLCEHGLTLKVLYSRLSNNYVIVSKGLTMTCCGTQHR